MAFTLSIHVPYFSPLSGDTGGGGATLARGLWAGHGQLAQAVGLRLSNVTQGLAAAVRMPLGRASPSQCRICRALVNPLKGGDFLRGPGRGLLLAKDRESFCSSLWSRLAQGTRLCQTLERHGWGRRQRSRVECQAHISPTAVQGRGHLQSPGKLVEEGLGYTWEIRQDFNQSGGEGQGMSGWVKLPGKAQTLARVSWGQRAAGMGWSFELCHRLDLGLECWPNLGREGAGARWEGRGSETRISWEQRASKTFMIGELCVASWAAPGQVEGHILATLG